MVSIYRRYWIRIFSASGCRGLFESRRRIVIQPRQQTVSSDLLIKKVADGAGVWNCCPDECTTLILLFLGGVRSSFFFHLCFSYLLISCFCALTVLLQDWIHYYTFLVFALSFPRGISKLIVASVYGNISNLMTVKDFIMLLTLRVLAWRSPEQDEL